MKRNLFLIKLALFLIVVFLAQIAIGRYITPSPEITRIDQILQNKPEVIFFGDSSVWHVADSDKNRSNLVDLFASFSGKKTENLGHPGYHLDIFAAEMEYITRSKVKPKMVILPIQLREFSPEWDMRPVNQFEKETFFLTDRSGFIPYFYEPLAIFRAIEVNAVSYSTFLETPVYYGERKVGVVNDFEAVDKLKPATEENVRNDYVYKYMGRLDSEHRKLGSLARILDLAKKADIQVYTYISPMDYQAGLRYVGSDFLVQASENAETICAFLEDHGAQCNNFAFSLNSEAFDHPAYPNEHMKEKGRIFVAHALSGAVQ